MRAVLAAIGSGGDLNPIAALGVELQRRGYAVTILAGEWQRAAVSALGLDFHCILSSEQFFSRFGETARLINAPGGGWMAFFQEAVMPAMEATYAYIVEHVAPDDALLVGSSHALGLRLAAERHGFRFVTTRLQPDPAHDPAASEQNAAFNRFFSVRLNHFRRRIGLRAIDQPFDRWLVDLRCAVAFFPDWFLHPAVDAPEQGTMVDFVFFDPSGDGAPLPALDAFLACHDAPLVFTHGTGNGSARTFFDAAADACVRLCRPAIFLSQFPDAIPPDLPPNVLHVHYAPLKGLLPYVDGVLHHGGIGTCAQALRAGVPQLVLPFGFDQQQNAARIERLGVGTTLDSARFSAEAIVEAFGRLLGDDATAARCRSLQRRFVRPDPLADCANAVLELAGLQDRSGTSAASRERRHEHSQEHSGLESGVHGHRA
jgi:rhamnosyltransferase subunit B